MIKSIIVSISLHSKLTTLDLDGYSLTSNEILEAARFVYFLLVYACIALKFSQILMGSRRAHGLPFYAEVSPKFL